jgi:predicted nucleic acid-binding protein
MITAVDTNVLIDLLVSNEAFVRRSTIAIEQAATEGSLVICDLVYAELCAAFSSQSECDAFVGDLEIRIEPLSRAASFLASRIWRTYRARGGKRTRILADFLIGAHAQQQASRLLSRDRGFYRETFPSLRLLDPARATV